VAGQTGAVILPADCSGRHERHKNPLSGHFPDAPAVAPPLNDS
jgi:hypothetical protein